MQVEPREPGEKLWNRSTGLSPAPLEEVLTHPSRVSSLNSGLLVGFESQDLAVSLLFSIIFIYFPEAEPSRRRSESRSAPPSRGGPRRRRCRRGSCPCPPPRLEACLAQAWLFKALAQAWKPECRAGTASSKALPLPMKTDQLSPSPCAPKSSLIGSMVPMQALPVPSCAHTYMALIFIS